MPANITIHRARLTTDHAAFVGRDAVPATRHRGVGIGRRPRGASIRCEQARESIARLVVITSNLSKATRSCVSDAEHEFPRIRSIGSNPMMLFRRSGYPQLLLMQPSLLRSREVVRKNEEGVFMIRKLNYHLRIQSRESVKRGVPGSGGPTRVASGP